MKIEKLKLYHFPVTRSARVKWALHETIGDDFETEVVNLMDGAQYSPDYVEMNPNHNVPMLEITWAGGEVSRMLESTAMVAFLADAFPEKQLAPSAHDLTPERADYLQMLHFGGTWMDMMLWQVRIHEHILGESQYDQRTIDRYREKFAKEVEPQLLARIEKGAFVCGDFTAADCVIGHNVFWARAYGMAQDDRFAEYVGRLSKRTAFQKAFADASQMKLPAKGERMDRPQFTG